MARLSKAELKRRAAARQLARDKAAQKAAGMDITWRDMPPDVQALLKKAPGSNTPAEDSLVVRWRTCDVFLEFDVGWCAEGTFGSAHTIDFGWQEVFDFLAGRDVRRDEVVEVVRRFMVRCYCHECLWPLPSDDDRLLALRATLEVRRAVARVNEVSLDGTPESEARLDAILGEEGKADLARQLYRLLKSNGRRQTPPEPVVEGARPPTAETLTGWAARTGDADVGRVLDYLERHESLAEDALVKLVGSPRKARAVAARLGDFAALGFEVKVSVVGPESPRVFQRVR